MDCFRESLTCTSKALPVPGGKVHKTCSMASPDLAYCTGVRGEGREQLQGRRSTSTTYDSTRTHGSYTHGNMRKGQHMSRICT